MSDEWRVRALARRPLALRVRTAARVRRPHDQDMGLPERPVCAHARGATRVHVRVEAHRQRQAGQRIHRQNGEDLGPRDRQMHKDTQRTRE